MHNIRPNKEDYYLDIADYQNTYIGKYAMDLEKYCDKLEKVIEYKAKYIKRLEKELIR